jgi:hypothetical protein
MDSPLCFSSATRRSEIAAGVIPDILDAWPIDAGRTFLSFSQTSREKPRVAS